MIADMSLYYLGYIIASCGFSLERVSVDYGYDVTIYTFDAKGQYENGNIFVQLKATENLDVDPSTGAVKHRIDKADVIMWEGEIFPVYLVVFDVQRERAHAVYVQEYLEEAGISSASMAHESLELRLAKTTVDSNTIRNWRVQKNAVLEQIGAVRHVG